MVQLFGRDWNRDTLARHVGHVSQLGGVRLVVLDNGPSRGVRLLEFRTGTGLCFDVAVDRGMDIGRCAFRGASLAWMPPTLLPGPWMFEDQSGFGWLRAALGGFNNTCGLVHIGNPETVPVPHYNFPARATQTYGVHDRAAMIPAELVSFGERWDGDRLLIEAVGRVTQAQAYGETLVLTRLYRTELGSSAVLMQDTVENQGYLPVQHMLLYHINVGFPLVADGAELLVAANRPPRLLFGEADATDPASWSRFIAPQKDWVQQTFEHDMRADAQGRAHVAIINPMLEDGLGLHVSYDKLVMPHYIEWRMMGEGQYAVGIEPCTNGFGREQVREAGELITLQPGDSRVYRTEFEVVTGAGKIEELRQRC